MQSQLGRTYIFYEMLRKINSDDLFFFDTMTDYEKTYGHFMQDNAMAHTNNSMNAFAEVFGERVFWTVTCQLTR
jgi:predicted sulfurtransferase